MCCKDRYPYTRPVIRKKKKVKSQKIGKKNNTRKIKIKIKNKVIKRKDKMKTY